MGWFGANKKTGVSDSNDVGPYRGVENLPVAVLVAADGNNVNSFNSVQVKPHQKTISVSHPTQMSPMILLSRVPTVLPQCPLCMKTNVRTRTVTSPNWMTWVTVAVLLVIFWPLCWIPLVTDSCRRTIHYCMFCNSEVGYIRPYKDCCVTYR
jgi:LITAF-like zinc ribbon domain